MDFLSTEQIWGVFMFGLGAFVLNWCSHWERAQSEWLKDPKNKYKKSNRKKEFILPTTTRGTFMTISGSLLSFAGITMFFMYTL
ncbi:hypothetical protein MNBD_NITROSPINAE05-124 [hydrothermal vent metagenome]|uniref:DUF3899 domain-containing protein n=1 Tax=hydrothermal vent metagenome TaxID=652676 RepID=A0A3B1DAU7_9ZZZZ